LSHTLDLENFAMAPTVGECSMNKRPHWPVVGSICWWRWTRPSAVDWPTLSPSC